MRENNIFMKIKIEGVCDIDGKFVENIVFCVNGKCNFF